MPAAVIFPKKLRLAIVIFSLLIVFYGTPWKPNPVIKPDDRQPSHHVSFVSKVSPLHDAVAPKRDKHMP